MVVWTDSLSWFVIVYIPTEAFAYTWLVFYTTPVLWLIATGLSVISAGNFLCLVSLRDKQLWLVFTFSGVPKFWLNGLPENGLDWVDTAVTRNTPKWPSRHFYYKDPNLLWSKYCLILRKLSSLYSIQNQPTDDTWFAVVQTKFLYSGQDNDVLLFFFFLLKAALLGSS